jgi:aminoglycoside phosphotransferase (APT) family kinase protein
MHEVADRLVRSSADDRASGWREPPDPRAVLRAIGVGTPEMIAAATLHDLSRSHALTYAELPDGPAYVVKCLSREAHLAGRSLSAELYTYRLATWQPALVPALATALHLDERRQVLVLDAVPMHHLFSVQGMEPGFPGPGLAAALGRTLAVIHTATAGLPLITIAACGVIHLPDTPPGQRRIGDGSGAAMALMESVVADPLLASALRRVAAALQPTCLIHADLKWDNVAMDPGPPAQVRLFDWELSGQGDPAWDVGSALADTVSLTIRMRGLAALPGDPETWLDPSLRALLGAYAEHTPASDGFAGRVAGCWVARLVHLAIECAAALEDADHQIVRDLVAAAQALAGRLDAVSATVGRALVAGR